jgi:dihydropyrimidinase
MSIVRDVSCIRRPKANSQDTPYEGKELLNWPRYTILRGKVIWAEGELKGEPYNGEYLKRGPSYFGTGPARRYRDAKKTATWLK